MLVCVDGCAAVAVLVRAASPIDGSAKSIVVLILGSLAVVRQACSLDGVFMDD